MIINTKKGGAGKPEQSKSVTITQNGIRTVMPDTGKTLSSVGITVNVPTAQIQTKTLTLGAGTPQGVLPDTGYLLNGVNVVIDTSVIKPENIAKNVNILGVTGTHEGGGGGATEPYVEESYDTNREVIAAVLHGYNIIRKQMYYYCQYLVNVTIPDTVTRIGQEAFYTCIRMRLTALPSALTRIDNSAFSTCRAITVSSTPSGLEYIGNTAFNGCIGITSMTFNAALQTIMGQAFMGCTALTTVNFLGTPTSLAANVFQNCTKLTTINVPWAQGAVANAPWGATNATINYNVT